VVVGSKKMAVFNDVADDKLLLYPHEIEWVNRSPVPVLKDAIVVDYEMKEPLKEECKHFLECIETREKPKTDGREGLRVLEILDASRESLESNGEKVLINKDSYYVHPSSFLDQTSTVGENTKIWHFSHVMSRAKIGDNCNVGHYVLIEPDVVIGNNVKVQNNVTITTGVKVEDYAFIGPSVVFTNIVNPRSFISRKDEFLETIVGKGASIGANSTIIGGNIIGEYAFVGAGSVVTHDVPDYALVFGNPARIEGWTCECGLKLNFSEQKIAVCSCGIEYENVENLVRKVK
jgi:UDP-2-acetamido-3-amino-2,3-dideoxy-glucuronate N-acetyltransferase